VDEFGSAIISPGISIILMRVLEGALIIYLPRFDLPRRCSQRIALQNAIGDRHRTRPSRRRLSLADSNNASRSRIEHERITPARSTTVSDSLSAIHPPSKVTFACYCKDKTARSERNLGIPYDVNQSEVERESIRPDQRDPRSFDESVAPRSESVHRSPF